MDCARCTELEARHAAVIDEYISIVERQSRMFVSGDTDAGLDLDDAIKRVKAEREAALRQLNEHRRTHEVM